MLVLLEFIWLVCIEFKWKDVIKSDWIRKTEGVYDGSRYQLSEIGGILFDFTEEVILEAIMRVICLRREFRNQHI